MPPTRHYDLAVIGSGSGNSILTEKLAEWDIAVIEDSVFGGTCLNVGCIPTKMYVYAADVAHQIATSGRYGVDAHIDAVRWSDIRNRVFGRIDPISESGRQHRLSAEHVTLLEGHARFTGPRALTVTGGADGRAEEITADQVVLATGSRATVPQVIADSGVPFHTSDTIMRIPRLPARLAIVGGGYIAAEFAHVFSALGTQVTIVTRGRTLLGRQDEEISRRFTALAGERWDVHLGAALARVSGDAASVDLELGDGTHVRADTLLVATGRTPNSDRLDLAAAGVEVGPGGRVVVDEYQRTTAPGVWALGDVSSAHQLKHVANQDSRIVANNLAHPERLRPSNHHAVPAAVFTEPQIAAVGLTEQEARDGGVSYVSSVQDFGATAYGWAMEDTTGFCKLLADPHTGLLLGAHLMGPQASILIQPLIQAMTFGQRLADVASGQYWIHPALTEVVENALLKLDLDAVPRPRREAAVVAAERHTADGHTADGHTADGHTAGGRAATGHHHAVGAEADRRYIATALGLLVAFLVLEVVVAVLSGSLVLLSDAGHMLSDVGALAVSLWAIRLAARPAAGAWTFGWKRAEILSAAGNGATLLVVSALVAFEAVRRLVHPAAVTGGPVLAVALVGVAVNLLAAWILRRADRSSLNVDGAVRHILTDLYGFIGTVVAAVIILATGYVRADSIASLIVVVLMLSSAWRLLRDSGRILLEVAPAGIDLVEIRNHLLETEHVTEVHDLHVWTVTSSLPALSAHVVIDDSCFHDGHAPQLLDDLQACLVGHFSVEHSTFQFEPAGHGSHEQGAH